MTFEENKNPDHIVEFSLDSMKVKRERKELAQIVFEALTKVVDERDIVGINFVPHWFKIPKKMQIQCKDDTVKETLMIRGFNADGGHIALQEPGLSPLRVTIQGAPTYVSNLALSQWLGQYGEIIDFRNDHLFIKGKQTHWRINTRVAVMKGLESPTSIPPWGKVKHRNKDVEFWVWYEGQDKMKCFSCNEIVPKTGHECTRGRGTLKRACFNCGSTSHLISGCKVGKVCHECKQPGHLAKNCTATKMTDENYPHLAHTSTPKGEVITVTNKDASSEGGPQGSMVSDRNVESSNKTKGNNDVNTVSTPQSIQVTADIHTQGDDEWQLDRQGKKRQRRETRRNNSASYDTPRHSNTCVNIDVNGIKSLGQVDLSKKELAGPSVDEVFEETLLKGFVTQPREQPTSDLSDEESEMEVQESEGMHQTQGEDEQKEVNETVVEEEQEVDETAEEATEEFVVEEEEKSGSDENDSKEEAETDEEDEEEDGDDFIDSSVVSPTPQMQKHEINVVSIGSSNMHEVKMAGDEELKINFQNLVTGGMKAQFSYVKFDEIENPESVDLAVLHVGTCNFKEGETTDVEELKGEFEFLIDALRKKCPEAAIVISSVLPRSSKNSVNERYKTVNLNILRLNVALIELCSQLEDVRFCSNYTFAANEDYTPLDDLFNDEVHLTAIGKQMLSDNIFECIKNLYFKKSVIPGILLNDDLLMVLSAPTQ